MMMSDPSLFNPTSSNSSYSEPVVIIGAGLAGLTCGFYLAKANIPFLIVEANSQVGGRVKTENYEGFLLDYGFQVFLTSYPEAQKVLNYEALDLKPFHNGAMVRLKGGFHLLADPWRSPGSSFKTLMSPVGFLADKFQVAKLRDRLVKGTEADIFKRPETTTLDLLSKNEKFSPEMIETFFKPFMGGIFLDRSLETSSRMFEFVFRMFSLGDTTLPANGMEAIPKHLAKGLPENSIRLNTRVEAVSPGVVRLDHANASEEVLNSPHIVVATNPMECHRLLPGFDIPPSRDVSVFYYAMAIPPFKEPMLILNGDEPGPINNLCILSQVAPGYAPKGQSLLSVTVLGMCEEEGDIEKKVRSQLKDWYGSSADTWRYLKKVSVKEAIPHAVGGKADLKPRALEFENGIWVCGDHQDTASINGAMASGRRVAEGIIAKVSPKSPSSISGKS